MHTSNAFANVLTVALDDGGFRQALAADLVGALEARGMRGDLSDKEVQDLEKIFAAPESKGQEASSVACGYRGFCQ